MIVFLVLAFGINKLTDKFPDSAFLKLGTITPIGAFMMGFSKIRYYEMQGNIYIIELIFRIEDGEIIPLLYFLGINFTWDSVNVSENGANSVSLLFCVFMLLFDTCLYFFLAYYITSINPGKFGARKSPFFIFKVI